MRTTPAETERNNQIIIDAAIEVFAEKGYVAANMQDIAARAKISRGPIYYRYKTKMDLFMAALAEYVVRELMEYRRILSQEKHILEIFREDLEFCTRSTREGQKLPELSVPDIPEMKEAQEVVVEASRKIFDIKVETVKHAIDKGEMRQDTDPYRVVNMMFVFAQGLRPMYGYQVTVQSDKAMQDAIDDLLYLIKSRYCIK